MSLFERETENNEFKKRLFLFTILVVVIFVLILSRLFYLQLINGERFKNLSENNRIRIREIKAPRGIIVDRKGRVLVENSPVFNLSIIPEDSKELEKVKEKLSSLLKINKISLDEEIAKGNNKQPFKPLRIKNNLTYREIALLETHRLELSGTSVDVEPIRYYLHNNLAAHLIGYMGKISKSQLNKAEYSGYRITDNVGKYGIEYEYEFYLKGKDGGQQVEVEATGRETRVLNEVQPKPGNRIFLTIDLEIQKLIETSLVGMKGSIIIMDPNNGDILALASSPSFDPNAFSRGISSKEWDSLVSNPYNPLENKVIQGQYPPGSLFKIVTAVAGLKENIISPETMLYCEGHYKFGRRNFRCWNRGGHGSVRLRKALVESCDIYFYKVGQQLGIEKISYYARSFGLGKKTGVSLLNEKQGLIPSKQWKKAAFNSQWQKGETLIVAIGQGFVLVTPIQILSLISSVANEGIIYIPNLVKKITSPNGDSIETFPPRTLKKISIDLKIFQFIKESLWSAVNDPKGTGLRARVEGANIAGKTGTAQVASLKNNNEKNIEKPFRLRDHAWFTAFAPLTEPQIAIVVMIEHGGGGGEIAAPIAQKIIKESLQILNREVQ